MESGITRTLRVHGGDASEKLKRVRDLINGRIPTPPTVDEVLASESQRLGMPLAVKKEEK
jgi:hypothetical protein